MKQRPLKHLYGLALTAAVALLLVGCNGKTGQSGRDGITPPAPTLTVDAAVLTPEQWADLKVTGTIIGVSIPATGARNPVVTFRLTDPAGNGVKGLGGFTSLSSTATVASYPNLSFGLAKLVPEDLATKAPSKWVSYIVNSVPTKNASGAIVAAQPNVPTTDNTGTLVDNGDGTYRYTFYRDITAMQAFLDAATYTGNNLKADLGNVAFEPSLVHRATIQFSGAARGTGSNTPNGVTVATAVNLGTPINVIYDFIPATGQPVPANTDLRDVVSTGKCNECHDRLGGTGFHGGNRVEVKYCVVCHTDQRKYGFPEATATPTGYDPNEIARPRPTPTGTDTLGQRKIKGGAVGDMTAMAHRVHMGTNLTKTGYNYASVFFDKLGYSMLDNGQRMCAKCHSGGSQADNWKMKPSRLACGTCHDSVDFSVAHDGIIRTDDSTCFSCHDTNDITTNHMTVNKTLHNPVVPAGLVNFTYQIDSATQATSGGPVAIKFRIMGSTGTATPTPVTFLPAATPMTNPLTGFTGSPSFLLAWALPQDGIAAPADYNNLATANGNPVASNFQPRTMSIATLLDTAKATSDGTLSGPDANGYYTANIVGANRVFPPGALMRSVSLQGYFTQITPAAARHAVSVIAYVDNSTTSPRRRTSIDSAKCADCHEWFEGHGGNRVYEVQVCVTCHVPGLTTSGRGLSDEGLSAAYDLGYFTDINKTSLKNWTKLDWATNPVTATQTNVALMFPQTTNNMKDMIHGIHAGKDRTNPIGIVRNRMSKNPTTLIWSGAVNVIDGANIGFPGILKNCQSCHTYNGYNLPTSGNLLATREEADNGVFINTINRTPADAAAALGTVNATDKMIRPFTAACVTCHDSASAKAHMVLNGGGENGQIVVLRSQINNSVESCAVCHGTGATYDPVKAHK